MDSVHKLGGCCSGSGEGDSISIPETKEVGLSTIGFDSLDEMTVQITLENGEILLVPYRQLER
jgi:hypothetical protein